MESAHCDTDAAILWHIDKPVDFVYPPGQKTGQIAFQWFWFARPLEWVFQAFADKIIDFMNFSLIYLMPVHVIFPCIFGPGYGRIGC
jgi:hypothetical protein